MKKKIALGLMMITLSMSLLVGCGASSDNVPESTQTLTVVSTEIPTTIEAPAPETTPETTKAPHEHTYIETVTTEATCEAEGIKTFTCECGDTYTETITATGHSFGAYVSNNDATYTADGTETAKCETCDVTDTRTAEGSMLTYTYTDMDATMYAQQTVNIRNMPSADGEKLGSLSANDEVKVTGQCEETSWYRIEYSGGVAYVSNSYLGNDKVVVEQPKTEQTNNGGGSQSNTASGNVDRTFEEALAYASSKYPMYQIIDDGDGTFSFYSLVSHNAGGIPEAYNSLTILHDAGFRMDGHISEERLYGSDGYAQWTIRGLNVVKN